MQLGAEPADAPIAVRDPELDTGIPRKIPAPTFAAPSARNSWFASTSYPPRIANARPVSTLSVYPTSSTPSAGSSRVE